MAGSSSLLVDSGFRVEMYGTSVRREETKRGCNWVNYSGDWGDDARKEHQCDGGAE